MIHMRWIVVMSLMVMCECLTSGETGKEIDRKTLKLVDELKACRFKIIHETYRHNNWELVIRNADGSKPVNISQTPDVDELFPHASPDGKKVVFIVDRGEGKKRVRDVYYMNIDGTNHVKVGQNGRQPFWSPDGTLIGYMRGTHVNYREGGSANKELYFYNIQTGKQVRHPKNDIEGLLNPCWSPNGRWILASVMGGMGLGHSIVIIETKGNKVIELRKSKSEAKDIWQCRPDISPDGKHVAWAKEDASDFMWVEVGDINLNSSEPKVTNRRYVATVRWPLEIYHVDWSPDGRYISYAQGKRGGKCSPQDTSLVTRQKVGTYG
ncbi:MAG: TolB family protein [Planctomycetota bacterium]